jgi:hypothetical protein
VCDNRHWWIQEWRLLLQEWKWETLEDLAVTINHEVSALCIKQGFNIFTFEPFANEKGLTEQMHMMHIAVFSDLTEEGDSPSGNRKRLMRDRVIGRQFSQFGSSATLVLATWLIRPEMSGKRGLSWYFTLIIFRE